jgi:hypothetical protein
MSVLAVGSIIVAAGGVLASMEMGAFSSYHHFGWPPVTKAKARSHELAFVFGSGIVAFTILLGLILVIGVEFDGYGSFGPSSGTWTQLWSSAFVAFAGILGQGFSSPQNGFGILGVALVVAVQLSHVVILLGATQKTWAK